MKIGLFQKKIRNPLIEDINGKRSGAKIFGIPGGMSKFERKTFLGGWGDGQCKKKKISRN